MPTLPVKHWQRLVQKATTPLTICLLQAASMEHERFLFNHVMSHRKFLNLRGSSTVEVARRLTVELDRQPLAPALSTARRAELETTIAERNLNPTGLQLSVLEMRETINTADPSLRPRPKASVQGLGRMKKAELETIAREKGLDFTAKTVDQLRLMIKGLPLPDQRIGGLTSTQATAGTSSSRPCCTVCREPMAYMSEEARGEGRWECLPCLTSKMMWMHGELYRDDWSEM